MKMKKTIFSVLALSLLLFSPGSFAQSPDKHPDSSEIMNARDWGGFVSIFAGGFSALSGTDNNPLFSYGLRAGMNLDQTGFSKFALDLTFNRESESVNISGLQSWQATNELLFQGLFREAWKTGFYFGPELGIAIMNVTQNIPNDQLSGSSVVFEFGGLAGYEFFVGKSFSFGPEVQLVHVWGSSISTTDINQVATGTGNTNAITAFKYLVTASIYF